MNSASLPALSCSTVGDGLEMIALSIFVVGMAAVLAYMQRGRG